MAQPAYIITPYYYENTSVSDVQTILNNLDTILAANGWTVSAPGGPYRTPNDPWGRWFRLAFTRISATRLQCAMTDDQARTTETREMDITGTQAIRYYYGTRYLYIENGGQDDTIYATLLSLAPESETVHNKYCVFFGTRNSGGARSSNSCGDLICVRSDSNAYLAQGGITALMFLNFGCNWAGANNYAVNLIHASGARRWFPAWSLGADTGSTYTLRGRSYNILMARYNWTAIGTEYTVPTDEATTGVFRILNIPQSSSQYYLAVRKS